MTIGIGIICSDSIILASDSQTTKGMSKDTTTQKLQVVNFANSQVLLAQANHADPAQMAIDFIGKRAKGKKLDGPETVKEVAAQSLADVRRYFWELDHLERLSNDQLTDYWSQKDCTLLVAYYCGRKPHLFRIDLGQGYCFDAKRHYESIGIGSSLADYLLSELVQPGLAFGDGYPLAVHILEKVIDHVDGCGRPTWAGFVYPLPEQVLALKMQANRPFFETEAIVNTPWRTELVVKELLEGEADARAIHRAYIQKVMERVTKKTLDRIWEEEVRLRESEERESFSEDIKAFEETQRTRLTRPGSDGSL